MALTIASPSNARDTTGVPGDMKYSIKTITFDSSYPTGGESIASTEVGLESIALVLLSPDHNGYVAQFDYTNSKISLWEAGADGAALDEFASTGDASAVIVRAIFYGR
jgi:hypothetical protein